MYYIRLTATATPIYHAYMYKIQIHFENPEKTTIKEEKIQYDAIL